MHLRKLPVLLVSLGLALAVLAGCRAVTTGETTVTVVVTLPLLEDMVRQVASDRVEVRALVPIGAEPENYAPVPADIRAITDATAFIYIGHHIERWLPGVAPHLDACDASFAVAEHPSIETLPVPSGPFAGRPDPHVWADVSNALVFVDQIESILSAVIPGDADLFRQRAESYRRELEELEDWIRDLLATIPEGSRWLITSELAFQYYAAAYGLHHDAIWPINAPEEGTPGQIARIVDLIRDRGIPVVFVESQVDPRPMEQVSGETGAPIAGVLYSDSLSDPAGDAPTYVDMMRSNTRLIASALGGNVEGASDPGR